MANTKDDDFSWGLIGETRWRELSEAAGASELQLRFAVLRHGGASQSAAARLAGYSGDDNAIRRAGYEAARSNAVENLLELAAVNAPQDSHLSEEEVTAKISKLIRSADSNVALKAIALRDDRAAAKAEQNMAPEQSPEDALRAVLRTTTVVGAPFVWCEIALRNMHWHAPGLREFVPFLAHHYPKEWASYRERLIGEYGQMRDHVEKLERGPVLAIDEILQRCGVGTPGSVVEAVDI